MPLFAGNCVNVKSETLKEEYFLSENQLKKQKYFFYPAQFWAHKNHKGLLQAFAEFEKKYPDYKLVFTGSDYGNLEYIRSLILEYKIENQVLTLGFLSIENINTLYRNATSLVMATYLGPTNMPPIEAMELGCPVICSDLAGHREILGDSAIYFNPMNKDELCNAMIKMVNNRTFYKEAIENRNKHSVFKIDNAIQKLNEYFKEIAIIRNCWK
jgi:glycosyltransferase involved in cell wall biosynthesis